MVVQIILGDPNVGETQRFDSDDDTKFVPNSLLVGLEATTQGEPWHK
jgi:hypothetical protein